MKCQIEAMKFRDVKKKMYKVENIENSYIATSYL